MRTLYPSVLVVSFKMSRTKQQLNLNSKLVRIDYMVPLLAFNSVRHQIHISVQNLSIVFFFHFPLVILTSPLPPSLIHPKRVGRNSKTSSKYLCHYL